MDEIAALAARAEDDTIDPRDLASSLADLLERSPGVGAAIALGLLAREPRIRPSRHLLIDPDDEAYRRWRLRVIAAAALRASAAGCVVERELADEFAESPDLERDVYEFTAATSATEVT